jgi:hypothetical protein
LARDLDEANLLGEHEEESS